MDDLEGAHKAPAPNLRKIKIFMGCSPLFIGYVGEFEKKFYVTIDFLPSDTIFIVKGRQ